MLLPLWENFVGVWVRGKLISFSFETYIVLTYNNIIAVIFFKIKKKC